MSALARPHSQDPQVSPRTHPRPEILPPPPLPTPLGPLVGRDRDVDVVVAALRDDHIRLVTLTGPGGVGKSRLALAAGAALHHDFADGVRLVRLAAVTDPANVLPAIAAALGLRESVEQSALATLQVALFDREMLLLLDNFEQILPAGTDVADLLRACPGVKALVTSRARLRVRGEHIVPVQPLGLPEDEAGLAADALMAYPAVELFVQRGREARPDLAESSGNLAAIARICRRLDGLPLALELAAARLDMLPPVALQERLQQALPLLVGGPRDLPDRLRTMRDAIAWSYTLLGAEEQRALRPLAVFVGGFTAAAATAVTGAGDELMTLDLLASLADKSLIRPLSSPAGQQNEPRFGMLQTIREFALEELTSCGEEETARDRHAAFLLGYAEQINPMLDDPGGDEWVIGIDAELENIRLALRWQRDRGNTEGRLRLAGALAYYWYFRGLLVEGQRWLADALAEPPAESNPRPRAWAMTALGLLANVCGDTERAASVLADSLEWWAQSDDPFGHAIARSLLGGVRVNQGDYREAERLFHANLPYFQETERYTWTAHALFHLGVVAFAEQDYALAATHMWDSIADCERIPSRMDTINPLRFLGLIACATGDHVAAAARFTELLALLRERDSTAATAVGLAAVATLAAEHAAWTVSAQLFAKAEDQLRTEAAAFSRPDGEQHWAAQERVRRALGDAAYHAAAEEGRALSLEQALGAAEAFLASVTVPLDQVSPSVSPGGPFTEREWDVLRLLAAGKSNPEIAEALYIGRGTVRTHVSNILGKLGARTRTEAAALARDQGLL